MKRSLVLLFVQLFVTALLQWTSSVSSNRTSDVPKSSPTESTTKDIRGIGGTIANFSKHSYHVDIQSKDFQTGHYTSHCGGSLINEKWVLSSASCFLRKNSGNKVKKDLRIIAGQETAYYSADVAGIGEEYVRDALKVYIHPEFKQIDPETFAWVKGNIALVELEKPFVLPNATTIRPVWPGLEPSDDSLVTTGFSRDEVNQNLMFYKMLIKEFEVCKDLANFHGNIPLDERDSDLLLCIEMNGDDRLCPRENGGALVSLPKFNPKFPEADKNFVVHAIVTLGTVSSENCYGKYILATRLDYYIEWIENILSVGPHT